MTLMKSTRIWKSIMLISGMMLFLPLTTYAESSPGVKDRVEPESIFGNRGDDLHRSHFTWGIELGSAIDVTSHDMSTFDADLLVGYKSDYVRFLGAGIGIQKAFGSGSTFIPVYAAFRSSFSSKPKLLFMHAKAGYSFNTMSGNPRMGDICGALGLGINLARTRNYNTHIVLGYEFRHFNSKHREALELDTDNVSLINLSFGINF